MFQQMQATIGILVNNMEKMQRIATKNQKMEGSRYAARSKHRDEEERGIEPSPINTHQSLANMSHRVK
jgi:hypothetical protein